MAQIGDLKDDLTTNPSNYYCQVCFESNEVKEGYQLPCEHRYCKDCLVSYLASKITDGKVYPTCFYIDENAQAASAEETTTEGQLRKYTTCNTAIAPEIIIALLQDRQDVLEKYMRYKFAKENSNARECPYCAVWNVVPPDVLALEGGSKITCCNTDCNKVRTYAAYYFLILSFWVCDSICFSGPSSW